MKQVIIALIAIFTLASCGKHERMTIAIERTNSNGLVVSTDTIKAPYNAFASDGFYEMQVGDTSSVMSTGGRWTRAIRVK